MTVLLLEAVLDGAVSGLAAVLLMILFEIPFWYGFGMSGVVQWQVNEILISKVLSEPYVEGKRLGWAIAMHLLHGIVLGAVFSILLSIVVPATTSILYLAGLAYSFALWILVPFSSRHRLERAGRTRFTRLGLEVSLIAHLVYGFSLGEFLFILLR